MLKFSSIATELQLMIAEKIEYMDLKHFSLTSKHGHHVASAIKYYPAIPVNINSQKNDFTIFPQMGTQLKLIKWSNIRHLSHLPRFAVNELQLDHDASLDSISDICENATFIRNNVSLYWIGNSSNPADIFTKLLDALQIFNFHSTEPLDPEFFPLLSEIEYVHIPTGDDYEALLQLKCKRLRVYNVDDPDRIAKLANLYFREWVLKKRDIKRFNAFTRYRSNLQKERVLEGLEFTLIWKHEGFNAEYRLQTDHSSSNSAGYHYFRESDYIFSIDRRDKKLLIFIRETLRMVSALEYSNLDNVLKIRRLI